MNFLLTTSGNVRVTYDNDPRNDRSESALAINPMNPRNLVGASKRFTDPANYKFSLAAYASFDAGVSWADAAPLPLVNGSVGSSDPAVAFDGAGNVYLVALPFDANMTILGIAMYKSIDGGMTWGAPTLIHASPGDDKQGAAADNSPMSSYYGHVYAAWDDGTTLRFARSTDNGLSWKGVGANPPGVGLEAVTDSFAPEIAVGSDGSVYIVWAAGEEFGTTIKCVKSVDGGGSFSAPMIAASGISPLKSPPLLAPDGFPELPDGNFRVLTVPVVCTGAGQTVVVAWADLREGPSRVYYQSSTDGGNTWGNGTPSGQPVNLNVPGDQHDFHPQLAGLPSGQVGCSFYRFGPKPSGTATASKIDVMFAMSDNDAFAFQRRITVTDRPWDPAIDAPLSHGDANTTFIGDYFGLAVSPPYGFFPFWTDTRTGMQEIYTARVFESAIIPVQPGLVNFLIGSLADGPLWRLTPHGVVPIPPWGPEVQNRDEFAMRTRRAIGQIAAGLTSLQELNREFMGEREASGAAAPEKDSAAA
jgi:hypothetical protein